MFIGGTEDSALAHNTISHGMVAFTIRTEVSNITEALTSYKLLKVHQKMAIYKIKGPMKCKCMLTCVD